MTDIVAGVLAAVAVLGGVGAFVACVVTSAGSRRHTRDTLAAIDQGWNANTRAWRIWNRPPEPVTAVQETTVRIAPRDARAAWPQPIPQTVVDHVALHRADAGRHRASDGAQ